ncbi:hypothetical protein HMPREF3088_00750 [Corynebacterium sp. HMSC22B11]|uniref:DUF4282 domain-containing protein n=1 Tax=Corynebacterium sp. HMSC22B11 TaxID=1581056 RepID=UPI0008A31691|nr:DUF4282 domain-containing protein [Corynebacterium sp. HMSC22B11]OFO17021.1 hypothetical protein HMPREF3088_00750 [Corynebacterium sp. HMSC22B11]
MDNPENQPSDFSPRTPGELTPEQARQANETFLQGQGMDHSAGDPSAEDHGAGTRGAGTRGVGAHAGVDVAPRAPFAAGSAGYPADQDPQGGSFLGALFDFSFRRYVTPSVAQVLYMVLFVVIGVAAGLALLGAVSVFFSGQPLGFSLLVFVLAVPPIVLITVAVLALSRVYLEVAVSLIRTSQSVQAIDARQEQRLRAMEQEQNQNPGQNHGAQN